MANYNILMNRFNGTTHDTLLPKNHLEGTSNPTTSTVGIVGQFYLNTATKQLFQCSTVSGSVYTWVPFYNATQTLDNTTKAKYGLASTATPNDVFGSLATNMVATRKIYPIKSGNVVSAGDVVDVVGGEVVGDIRPVGTAPVGTILKLQENGVLVDYIVVHQGLPSALYDSSCNGTWVLRKDILEARAWNSSAANDYENSAIKPYLDSTVLNLFDTATKAAIKQVKIPYRPGTAGTTVNSGANGLVCKVFLLSGYEIGWTVSEITGMPADGAKLSYFESGTGSVANAKRVATLSGVIANWWLRSPYTGNTTSAFLSTHTGTNNYVPTTQNNGVRTAMVIDPSFLLKYETTKTQAIALQSGTAGQSIDIIYDGVAELPGITAGAQITSPGVQGYAPQDGWLWVKPEWDVGSQEIEYIGTGVYGASNPNIIYFGTSPRVVIIKSLAQSDLPLAIFLRGAGGSLLGGAGAVALPTVWANDHIEWYNTTSATLQLNTGGTRYRALMLY